MDPIADMLNQIKNAQAVGHPAVSLPCSNVKYEVARILEQEGFISKIEKKGRKAKKILQLTLKYNDKEPVIVSIKKISKPGQRIYRSHSEMRSPRGGYGVGIVSTNKGMMTVKDARKQKLGGELICEVF